MDGDNVDHLITSLTELFGHEAVQVAEQNSSLQVRGENYGRQERADVVVTIDKARGVDVGFRLNPNTNKFTVVADWYLVGQCQDTLKKAGIKGSGRQPFVKKVHEGYVHSTTAAALGRKGFRDVSQKNQYRDVQQENGTTRKARVLKFQRRRL